MNVQRRFPGDDAMAEIARAIGEDAARSLARHFGGTTLYVPRVVGDHHPICAALGRASADQLADWAGGGPLAIPKQAERRARVRELRAAGRLTIGQIAVQTAFSERHVYRLLSDEADERQPSLFGDPA
ncbi:hypothetical protein BH09PSE4_BH09PSE4_14640 [soil metagenome]